MRSRIAILGSVLLVLIAADAKAQQTGRVEEDEARKISAAYQNLKSDDMPKLMERAEAGDITSQILLGLAYQDGRLVAKNPTEAAKWHPKAAEQGNAAAQFFLGNLYASGEGVPKDLAEVARLWRNAAQLGKGFLLHHEV